MYICTYILNYFYILKLLYIKIILVSHLIKCEI